ncbi:MAG: S-methyl-5-thioribose-1-phosphate isomerase [Candidatus Omnitrophota bacterium]
MNIETIRWKNGAVELIDQTLLPNRFRYKRCRDVRVLWEAIKKLRVRGAPAIGIAGALGIALGIRNVKTSDHDTFMRKLRDVKRYLASSRPTAVNLFWALDRMENVALQNKGTGVRRIKQLLLKEALAILDEDKKICREMAAFGARLIRKHDSILTHCNAGGLATADYGTALGALFRASEQGKRIHVYVDETRPLLQGARLTAWELMRRKIDSTLICDNMAASLMAKGAIDKIFVGADRIASNGDVANKIGTYSLAALAKAHGIPFYVVAPSSTFDMNIRDGREIPIEERDADEVRTIRGKQIAHRRVKVYNPAFDVTPNSLVSAIVTERGIFVKPYRKSLRVMKK